MKRAASVCVLLGMDTQLTIAEYASRHGVSVVTVRRRIKAGVFLCVLPMGVILLLSRGLTIERVDSQNDHADSHTAPDENAMNSGLKEEMVARLQSEVDYLREQLDKQTSLLALATQ